jgi:hypothetical protein
LPLISENMPPQVQMLPPTQAHSACALFK